MKNKEQNKFELQIVSTANGWAYALRSENKALLDNNKDYILNAGFTLSDKGSYYTGSEEVSYGVVNIPIPVRSLFSGTHLSSISNPSPWVVMGDDFNIQFIANAKAGQLPTTVVAVTNIANHEALLYAGFKRTPSGALYLAHPEERPFQSHTEMVSHLLSAARLAATRMGYSAEAVAKGIYIDFVPFNQVLGAEPYVKQERSFSLPQLEPQNALVADEVIGSVDELDAEPLVVSKDKKENELGESLSSLRSIGATEIPNLINKKHQAGKDFIAYLATAKKDGLLLTATDGVLDKVEVLNGTDKTSVIEFEEGKVKKATVHLAGIDTDVVLVGSKAEKQWEVYRSQIEREKDPSFYIYAGGLNATKEEVRSWASDLDNQSAQVVDSVEGDVRFAEEQAVSATVGGASVAKPEKEEPKLIGVNVLNENVYQGKQPFVNTDSGIEAYSGKAGKNGLRDRLRYLVIDTEAVSAGTLPLVIGSVFNRVLADKSAVKNKQWLVNEVAKITGTESTVFSDDFNDVLEKAATMLADKDYIKSLEEIAANENTVDSLDDIAKTLETLPPSMQPKPAQEEATTPKKPTDSRSSLVKAMSLVQIVEALAKQSEARQRSESRDNSNVSIITASEFVNAVISGNGLDSDIVASCPYTTEYLMQQEELGNYPLSKELSEQVMSELSQRNAGFNEQIPVENIQDSAIIDSTLYDTISEGVDNDNTVGTNDEKSLGGEPTREGGQTAAQGQGSGLGAESGSSPSSGADDSGNGLNGEQGLHGVGSVGADSQQVHATTTRESIAGANGNPLAFANFNAEQLDENGLPTESNEGIVNFFNLLKADKLERVGNLSIKQGRVSTNWITFINPADNKLYLSSQVAADSSLLVGLNSDGELLSVSEQGVRSKIIGAIAINETVSLIPTNAGILTQRKALKPEFAIAKGIGSAVDDNPNSFSLHLFANTEARKVADEAIKLAGDVCLSAINLGKQKELIEAHPDSLSIARSMVEQGEVDNINRILGTDFKPVGSGSLLDRQLAGLHLENAYISEHLTHRMYEIFREEQASKQTFKFSKEIAEHFGGEGLQGSKEYTELLLSVDSFIRANPETPPQILVGTNDKTYDVVCAITKNKIHKGLTAGELSALDEKQELEAVVNKDNAVWVIYNEKPINVLFQLKEIGIEDSVFGIVDDKASKYGYPVSDSSKASPEDSIYIPDLFTELATVKLELPALGANNELVVCQTAMSSAETASNKNLVELDYAPISAYQSQLYFQHDKYGTLIGCDKITKDYVFQNRSGVRTYVGRGEEGKVVTEKLYPLGSNAYIKNGVKLTESGNLHAVINGAKLRKNGLQFSDILQDMKVVHAANINPDLGIARYTDIVRKLHNYVDSKVNKEAILNRVIATTALGISDDRLQELFKENINELSQAYQVPSELKELFDFHFDNRNVYLVDKLGGFVHDLVGGIKGGYYDSYYIDGKTKVSAWAWPVTDVDMVAENLIKNKAAYLEALEAFKPTSSNTMYIPNALSSLSPELLTTIAYTHTAIRTYDVENYPLDVSLRRIAPLLLEAQAGDKTAWLNQVRNLGAEVVLGSLRANDYLGIISGERPDTKVHVSGGYQDKEIVFISSPSKDGINRKVLIENHAAIGSVYCFEPKEGYLPTTAGIDYVVYELRNTIRKRSMDKQDVSELGYEKVNLPEEANGREDLAEYVSRSFGSGKNVEIEIENGMTIYLNGDNANFPEENSIIKQGSISFYDNGYAYAVDDDFLRKLGLATIESQAQHLAYAFNNSEIERLAGVNYPVLLSDAMVNKMNSSFFYNGTDIDAPERFSRFTSSKYHDLTTSLENTVSSLQAMLDSGVDVKDAFLDSDAEKWLGKKESLQEMMVADNYSDSLVYDASLLGLGKQYDTIQEKLSEISQERDLSIELEGQPFKLVKPEENENTYNLGLEDGFLDTVNMLFEQSKLKNGDVSENGVSVVLEGMNNSLAKAKMVVSKAGSIKTIEGNEWVYNLDYNQYTAPNGYKGSIGDGAGSITTLNEIITNYSKQLHNSKANGLTVQVFANNEGASTFSYVTEGGKVESYSPNFNETNVIDLTGSANFINLLNADDTFVNEIAYKLSHAVEGTELRLPEEAINGVDSSLANAKFIVGEGDVKSLVHGGKNVGLDAIVLSRITDPEVIDSPLATANIYSYKDLLGENVANKLLRSSGWDVEPDYWKDAPTITGENIGFANDIQRYFPRIFNDVAGTSFIPSQDFKGRFTSNNTSLAVTTGFFEFANSGELPLPLEMLHGWVQKNKVGVNALADQSIKAVANLAKLGVSDAFILTDEKGNEIDFDADGIVQSIHDLEGDRYFSKLVSGTFGSELARYFHKDSGFESSQDFDVFVDGVNYQGKISLNTNTLQSIVFTEQYASRYFPKSEYDSIREQSTELTDEIRQALGDKIKANVAAYKLRVAEIEPSVENLSKALSSHGWQRDLNSTHPKNVYFKKGEQLIELELGKKYGSNGVDSVLFSKARLEENKSTVRSISGTDDFTINNNLEHFLKEVEGFVYGKESTLDLTEDSKPKINADELTADTSDNADELTVDTSDNAAPKTDTKPTGSAVGGSSGVDVEDKEPEHQDLFGGAGGSEEKQETEEQNTAGGFEEKQETEEQNTAGNVSDFKLADDIGEGSIDEKFKNNIAAVKLLKELEAEAESMGVNASDLINDEQRSVLSRYVGWGGLSNAFGINGKYKEGWEERGRELEELLTEAEYESARKSTTSSFYTPVPVIDSLYKGLERMGVSGRLEYLEPALGTGNFVGRMPDSMREKVNLTGIELDSLTGRIAKSIYEKGESNVHVMGFEHYQQPEGSFDLVVANPPYGQERVFDRGLPHINASIHNYFIMKANHLLRPKGIQAVVVSRYFMDAKDDTVRSMIAQEAELVGGFRLPREVFKEGANTEAVTDLLFFQKRETPLKGLTNREKEENAEFSWVNAVDCEVDGDKLVMNKYFIDNPERVLGEVISGTNQFGNTLDVTINGRYEDMAEFHKALTNSVEIMLPEGLFDADMNMGKKRKQSKGQEHGIFRKDYFEIPVENLSHGMMFTYEGETYERLPDSNLEFAAAKVTTRMGSNGNLIPLSKLDFDRVYQMVQTREALDELLLAEQNDSSDELLADLRQKLNTRYDSFVKKHGAINNKRNRRLIRQDAAYVRAIALEADYLEEVRDTKANREKGHEPRKESWRKADVFSERVLNREADRFVVETPDDALVSSLNEKGRVDIEYMLNALEGKYTKEEMLEALKDDVFLDPETYKYEWSPIYLSGNVKKKLLKAEEAAMGDSTFIPNLTALREVQPSRVPFEEIGLSMGAHWLTTEVHEKFLRHLNKNEDAWLDVNFNQMDNTWSISGRANPQLNNEWSNDFVRVYNSALVNKPIRITRKEGTTTVLDEQATIEANNKVAKLKLEFANWCRDNDEISSLIEDRFNDIMNTTVRTSFVAPESYKPKGIVPESVFKPRQHQRDYVFRSLLTDNISAVHFAGAGKTASEIIATMEQIRTGQIRKALIVVPNHLTGQWSGEIQRLYPSAKVMTPSKEDFVKSNRERMFARIATGNWDMVVIGHSQLIKLPIDADISAQFIRQEISELRATLAENNEGAKSRSVKRIETMITNRQAQLERLLDSKNGFVGVTVNELGIDKFICDEAHNFKNLAFATNLQVSGLGNPAGSQKAFNFLVHASRIQQIGGKTATLSATPLSNSVSEMYAWLRYNNPKGLKDAGIKSFDSFVNSFAEVSADLELTMTGEKYKIVSRLSKFTNLTELLNLYLDAADTVSPTDVKKAIIENGGEWFVPAVRNGGSEVISIQQTPEQEILYEELRERMEVLDDKTAKIDPKVDNKLKLLSDARKVSLHPRMYDSSSEEFYDGKIKAAVEFFRKEADRMIEQVGETGLHLGFCDLGVPKGAKSAERTKLASIFERLDSTDEEEYRKAEAELAKYSALEIEDIMSDDSFSFQEVLRECLTTHGGFDRSRIASLHDCKTDDDRTALFARCNNGEIDILLATTKKGGEGMNVSRRIAGVLHIDAPWRPSDLEQRRRRAERQGNTFFEADNKFEVYNTYLVTEGTSDAWMYQTLESKSAALNNIIYGNVDGREMEDVGVSADDLGNIKALASGSGLVLQQHEAMHEAKMVEAELISQKDAARKHRRTEIEFKTDIPRMEKTLERMKKFVAHVEANPSEEVTVMELDEKTGKEVKRTRVGMTTEIVGQDEVIPDALTAGRLIAAEVRRQNNFRIVEDYKLATVRGVDLYFNKDIRKGWQQLTYSTGDFEFDVSYEDITSVNPNTFGASINSSIDGIAHRAEILEGDIEYKKQQYERFLKSDVPVVDESLNTKLDELGKKVAEIALEIEAEKNVPVKLEAVNDTIESLSSKYGVLLGNVPDYDEYYNKVMAEIEAIKTEVESGNGYPRSDFAKDKVAATMGLREQRNAHGLSKRELMLADIRMQATSEREMIIISDEQANDMLQDTLASYEWAKEVLTDPAVETCLNEIKNKIKYEYDPEKGIESPDIANSLTTLEDLMELKAGEKGIVRGITSEDVANKVMGQPDDALDRDANSSPAP